MGGQIWQAFWSSGQEKYPQFFTFFVLPAILASRWLSPRALPPLFAKKKVLDEDELPPFLF
jgi:hypothetical protein